jgi:uncharacterized protein
MKQFFVLASGILFGAGLALSGMTNPMKVLNFMDIAGFFDPTLIFVMGAGLLTTLLGYTIVLKRPSPLFSDRFCLPLSQAIDTRLMLGAALFGLGWGITGFCPDRPSPVWCSVTPKASSSSPPCQPASGLNDCLPRNPKARSADAELLLQVGA